MGEHRCVSTLQNALDISILDSHASVAQHVQDRCGTLLQTALHLSLEAAFDPTESFPFPPQPLPALEAPPNHRIAPFRDGLGLIQRNQLWQFAPLIERGRVGKIVKLSSIRDRDELIEARLPHTDRKVQDAIEQSLKLFVRDAVTLRVARLNVRAP